MALDVCEVKIGCATVETEEVEEVFEIELEESVEMSVDAEL